MNKSFTMVGFVSSIVTLLLFYIPNLDLETKLKITIVFLILLIIMLIFYYIRGYDKKLRIIKREYSELEQKHKSLSLQFKEKQQIIKDYQNVQFFIMNLLLIANSKSKDAKLDQILSSVTYAYKNIKGGD